MSTPTPTNATSTGSSFGTDSVETASSSNTIEVVVHNFSSGQTDRYSVDGPVQGGSGSKNTDHIVDDRRWVRNDTQYAPWDPEFAPIVSLGGCTGALVDEYHVLTAAHCVYNNSNQSWIQDVTVAPGTERVGADTTRPYATADVVLARAYGPFVDSTDPSGDQQAALNDMALLTIDRPLGARAGTLDFAYEGETSVDQSVYDGHRVDVAGYPGKPPSERAPTPTLWWDHGNTTGAVCETNYLIFTTCREAGLVYDVYTSKGQSGSPVVHNPAWADSGTYLTSDATILAVHAYGRYDSDGAISGWGPRITPNRSDHIERWINTDDATTGGDAFAYQAPSRPALSFVSVETTPADQWYDWERTTPSLEVVNNTTLRYERDLVNLGTESFSATVTIDVRSDAFGDFTKEVEVDSLAPGESVPVVIERRVTSGPGDASLTLTLSSGAPFPVALTTYSIQRFVVRATGDAWHGRQYDQRLTGYNPHTAALRGPGIATDWSVSIDDDGWTSVAIKNGTAYAVSQTGTLYAIDTATGEVAWQTHVGAPDTSVNEAGVAVGHGNVYVGVDNFNTNATVYAVNTTTREVAWTVDGHGPRVDGITPTESAVYVHSSGVFYAAPSDGTVFRNTSYASGQGAPAVVPDDLVVVAQAGNVTGYSTGLDEEWTLDVARLVEGVTAGDEFVFARDGNDSLYAIDSDSDDARVVWEFSAAADWNVDVEPVVVGDRVIIGDDSGVLYALSTANGVAYWTTPLPSGVRTVAGANGTVYATTEGGEVYAVDAADGSVLWNESVGGGLYAHPAVVDGRVVVPTAEGDTGRVVALRRSRPRPAFTYTPADPVTDETVTFDAANTTAPGGTIAEYAWDFDDDGTTDATGVEAPHAFGSSGQYPVTLTVTTDEGATNATTETVAVGSRPPEARFTHEVPVVGEPTAFDAGNSSDPDGYITAYEWDFDGDGAIDDTGVSPGYTFETTGEHAVALTVTDNASFTDTTEQVINATERPVPRFDYTEPVVNRSIVFDAANSTDDGAIASSEWDLDGDGAFEASGETVNHTYETTGDRQVTLRVTDDRGVTNTTTRTVPVTAPPVPVLEASTLFSVAGESVTFGSSSARDPDGTIVSREWDVDGDGVYETTGQRASRSFESPGTYPVRLRVTDDVGIERTTRRLVTVVGPHDWALGGYGPDNTHANPHTTPLPTPPAGDDIRPRFETDVGTYGAGRPAVLNGTVYAATYDDTGGGNVSAADLRTGEVRWRRGVGAVQDVPVSAADGTVYVAVDAGVTAFDTDDGRTRWHADATDAPDTNSGGSVAGAPVVHDASVYATDITGNVFAVNRTSGTARWATDVGDDFEVGPAVANRTVYAVNTSGGLVALWAGNGSVRWRHDLGGYVDDAPPMVVGNTVYARGENVTALNATTGAVEWTTDVSGGQLAYANGTLWVGTGDGLAALDPATGARLRSLSTTPYTDRFTVADGVAYVGDSVFEGDPSTFAYRLSDGTELWTATESEDVAGGPVVANGTAYALFTDGTLRALASLNAPPVADIDATPLRPVAGERITLDASESVDESPGTIVSYEWDVDGDGQFEATDETLTLTPDAGVRQVRLTVTDDEGATDSATMPLTVYGPHDWPALGYDPGATGANPNTVGPVSNVSWRWNRTYENVTRPAVADGTLYVGTVTGPNGTNGSLVALDTAGRERWNRSLGPVEHVPGVTNGTAFAVTGAGITGTGLSDDDGVLYGVDAGTGQPRWHRDTYAAPMDGPAVAGPRVYVGLDGGSLKAYERSISGSAWSYSVFNDATAPALAAGTAYVGTGVGDVYAVDRETGEQRWSESTYMPRIHAPPAVAGDRVFVAASDDPQYDKPGKVLAINRTTGQTQWADFTQGRLFGSPAVARGTVLASVHGGDAGESAKLVAYDATPGADDTDGERLWTFRTNATGLSAPTVVGGTVYVATTNASTHRLFAVALADGSRRFAVGTGAPANGRPVVSNGTVYLAAGDRLRALNGTTADLSGARARVPNVTNAGSPATVLVDTSRTQGTVANVTVETPDGDRVPAERVAPDQWRATVTFANHTWNGSAYAPATASVTLAAESGVRETVAAETPVYTAGDADGDGTVNIFDAVAVGNAWKADRGAADYSDGADLNNDGVVNIFDAVVIGNNWNDAA